MFNNTSTTRGQGDIGLTFAIYKLSEMGYTVSLPITDNNIYDLIVDIAGKLKSVQVKTSSVIRDSGNYEVQLRRIRTNTSQTKIHKFDNTEVDILFVVLENGESYMIPSIELTVKNTLTICEKYKKYKMER